MINKNKLYAKRDFKKEGENGGSWWISEEEAPKYNKRNFGIFWSPNSEEFQKNRLKENVKHIYWWFADLDAKISGGKEEQLKRINSLPCKPNWLVETRNGYHCYWKSKDGTVENFESISKGIISKLGSDPAVSFCSALLRAPNYYHCKDPNNKFLVHTIYETNEEFSEEEMLFYFKPPVDRRKEVINKYEGKGLEFFKNPDNWEKIFHLSWIIDGHRNSELSKAAYKAYMNGFRGNDLLVLMTNLNQKIAGKPLPQDEINAMIRRLK